MPAPVLAARTDERAQRTPPSEILPAGAVIGRRYQVRGLIGRGAMGFVYEAWSLPTALAAHGVQRVALKVLARERLAERQTVAWFIHEALLGMTLDHPNLVRALDYGRMRGRLPYYAMELVEGESLEEILRVQPTLPTPLVLSLLADAAAALEHLHRHGIVHRDVKPANLLVIPGREGEPPRARLLDLGVAGVFEPVKARRLGIENVGARGTWGTPRYIAPEQAIGQQSGPAADAYALACVAYRMLTGHDSHRGTTITALVRSHLFDTPAPPSRLRPSLPASADAVFEWALEKDARRRIPTPARLVAELTAALRS